jgi:hypothetical protein
MTTRPLSRTVSLDVTQVLSADAWLHDYRVESSEKYEKPAFLATGTLSSTAGWYHSKLSFRLSHCCLSV